MVAEPGKEDEVRRILGKWELERAVIGHVTDDGRFRVLEDGRTVADIPALPLTEGCPTYEREGIEDPEVAALRALDLSGHATPTGDLTELFLRVVGSPNVASKRWVYGQYDTTVRTSTAVAPRGRCRRRAHPWHPSGRRGHHGLQRPLRLSRPGHGRARRGRGGRAQPRVRGRAAAAITNNLNFGNPLKPHIYHQFREAVLGMAEACKVFETPVTGGNVSFYNETDGRAILPTPVIGMVGVVEDVDHITRPAFQAAGDVVILLGRNTDELGGSEYLYVTADLVAGAAPAVDLLAERSLQRAVLAMIHEGALRSAHDCAEGGLACALAESALGSGEEPVGVDVALDDDLPPVAALFGEANGRVVVSCTPEHADTVLRIAERHGVPARRIGTVGEPGGPFRMHVANATVEADAARVADAFFGAIPRIMDAPAPSGA